MQRKDIDAAEYVDLQAGMMDATISDGDIRIVSGRHGAYGALILVGSAGSYAVLGNDVELIPGRDETVETDIVGWAAERLSL